MHNVDILQQQMAAMVAAPTSSSTPVAIEETLQTLANNQVRQQEYLVQVQEILTHLAQRTPNAPVPNALTTKLKGDPTGMSLYQFRSQLSTMFSRHPRSFGSDAEKINFALQSMDGTPAEFFALYVIGQAVDTQGFLTTWKSFTKILNDLYGNHLHTDDVNNRLIRLRQTGTVSEYIAKFQPLASQSGWNDVALLARFKDGLSSDVKSLLTAQMHILTTLRDTQAAASTAYQNQASRARDQRFGNRTQSSANSWPRRHPATAVTTAAATSSSSDMDLDTVRIKQSPPKKNNVVVTTSSASIVEARTTSLVIVPSRRPASQPSPLTRIRKTSRPRSHRGLDLRPRPRCAYPPGPARTSSLLPPHSYHRSSP